MSDYQLLANDVPDSAQLQVLQFPHPSLSAKCSPVTKVGPKLLAAVEQMRALLEAQEGVGLAANQVGITERFCLVKMGQDTEVLVNPVIVKRSGKPKKGLEGCLSIRGMLAEVSRFQDIVVEYYGLDGQRRRKRVTALTAAIVQHELAHLDGKTLMDESVDIFPVASAMRALGEPV